MRATYVLLLLCLLGLFQPAFAVDDIYGPGSKTNAGDGARTSAADFGMSTPDGLPAVGESPWEEFYYQELDLTGLMARVHELLVSEKYLGKHPEVVAVAKLLEEEGFFKLAGVTTKYAITGDGVHFFSETSFHELDPAVYPGNLLALPNAVPQSARYLDADGYLMYFAVNNVADIVKIEMEQLKRNMESLGEDGQEVMSEVLSELGLDDAGQILQLMQVMRVDQLATEVMTGEIALVLYDTSDALSIFERDLQPADIDGALFVGIKDAAYITNMLDRYGVEAGLTKTTDGPAGWTVYYLANEPSVGLVVSDELVVATPNLTALFGHLDNAQGVEIAPCQMYCDFNLAKLHERWIGPLAAMGMAEFDEDVTLPVEAAAFLFNLPESPALGHMKMSSAYSGDRHAGELHLNKAVVQYALYYLGVFGCGIAQTEGVDFDF